jgi:RNA polymerase sigma-70 factor, ECF subfamily
MELTMDSHMPSSSIPGEDAFLPEPAFDDRIDPRRHPRMPDGASACARARAPRAAHEARRQSARRWLFSEASLRRVSRWLRKLGVRRGDLDDVVQSVMLQALQSFAGYNAEGARPERWLNAITVHVASHHHQKAHRRARLLRVAHEAHVGPVEDRPDPEQALAAAESLRELHTALFGVRPRLRWILVAHDLEGNPMAELARTRRMPISTTYRWRDRALADVRAALCRRDARVPRR